MKKFLYAVLFCIVVMGSAFVGSRYGLRDTSRGTPSGADRQVRVERTSATNAAEDPDDSSLPPGTVKISSIGQQTIGIRTGVVEKKSMTHTLRILGRVAVDDTRVYRVNAAIDGWILKTFDNSAGCLLKKDELLATYYSPEFLGVVQAYLFALSSADRYQASGRETPEQINLTKTDVRQNENTLRNIGMSELQIKEIAQSRKYTEEIYVTAPVTGFVLARNVSPGEQFNKGKELYRFVDLSRVWILADIFENEARFAPPPGKTVKATLPYQNKTFDAKVTDVLPLFDGTSRTLKIRLETDNPGYFLRPDMFVDIDLPVALPATISVPDDAIVDSGFRKTVFVDRGNGSFEPRRVETGRHLGNRVEILKGLAPGERIALSATFLIDSESRMDLAGEGVHEALGKDPVSGEEVSLKKADRAGRRSSYKGRTYYFSSAETKARFEKDPDRYAEKSDEEEPCRDMTPAGKSSEEREPGA